MDLIFSKVFKKQNITFVEDDNYYNPLKKDAISDLETQYGDLIIDEIKEEPKVEPVVNNTVKLSNPYIEEMRRKYKPEELTDDGIPTIETQLREIKEADEKIKEYNYNKEMVNRVKCISLYKMKKSILTNTLHLNARDRASLQNIMHSYNDIPHAEIIREFNDIANTELFDNPNIDYSNLPIYNA
jgi:hypothetical protein